MKNLLYTTGIALLLLSPMTCNYETKEIIDSEIEDNQTLSVETENVDVNVTVIYDEYGQPIIKPTKP